MATTRIVRSKIFIVVPEIAAEQVVFSVILELAAEQVVFNVIFESC